MGISLGHTCSVLQSSDLCEHLCAQITASQTCAGVLPVPVVCGCLPRKALGRRGLLGPVLDSIIALPSVLKFCMCLATSSAAPHEGGALCGSNAWTCEPVPLVHLPLICCRRLRPS